MKKILLSFVLLAMSLMTFAQQTTTEKEKEKEALKFNLNSDGSHYFQVTFLNQTWLRYNQNNPGTTLESQAQANTFDIGLRRTRMQIFGQINDKVFVYFQFGQNNFNSQYAIGGNRKLAPFFHDAVCDYKLSKGNQLRLGGGLTIANGLSRFSQPSIGSIMTMDVPVFAQATVDQTDQFSRKLSVYARGQVGKFDYRFVLSNPFPVTSNGSTAVATAPESNTFATFSSVGHHLQQQGYLIYQFFDHEQNQTPYMTGTYLGKKKVFNIAAGAIYQKNAMWMGTTNGTEFQDMKLFAVESFLDMPVNKDKETAVNAYVGYFNTNYGTNYLRYNGIMNVANGTNLAANTYLTGQGAVYGNALPMFGTGQSVYTQFGYLLGKDALKNGARLMPYASATLAKFDRLGGLTTNTYNVGLNYLVMGHKAKFTLDVQNRPTYKVDNGTVLSDKRMNCVTLQYQIFF
jgi:hypothetical protein